MRPISLLPSILLAAALATAPDAHAQSINLRWDECYAGGGVHDVDDPCTSQSGVGHALVVSVEPGGAFQIVGAEAQIELQFDQAGVPDWWQVASGGCRAGRLVGSLAFAAEQMTACGDPWNGQAVGALAFEPGVGGICKARLTLTAALAEPTMIDPAQAQEWYIAAVKIVRSGTAGCAGCSEPACLTLNHVKLLRPAGASDIVLTTGFANFTTWQGGMTGCFATHPLECPEPVPARTSTWGLVKSLYR